MPRDWEDTFRSWSGPSSPTEQDKQDRAERMVREAIRGSDTLRGRQIEVFPQGSYRNNTNVREESDVDICVCYMPVFFYDLSMSGGLTKEDVGISDSPYTYAQFKNEVGAALVAKFGWRGVTRGNKAFDVHESTARVDADVVPCLEHRRYTGRDASGGYPYLSGTQFRPDAGGSITNWPKQHYENGVAKNNATGGRFKRIVRVLKRLRNEMADHDVAAAKPIASYLIECLVWNVPNGDFSNGRYSDDVRNVLIHTFNATKSDDGCRQWVEVSGLKWLFWPGQPWTRDQANAFLLGAWGYVEFK